MRKLLVFIILGMTLLSVKAQGPKKIHLEFSQNDNTYSIKKRHRTIGLERSEFSLTFDVATYDEENERYNGIQIAIGKGDDFLERMQEGSKEDVSYYSEGSGLAAGLNEPYLTAYLNNEAHHYIYYLNDQDKRGEIIEKKNHGVVRLKWTIYSMTTPSGEETAISETDFEKLYFVVFTDKNLNKIVEKGEYHLVTLKFK